MSPEHAGLTQAALLPCPHEARDACVDWSALLPPRHIATNAIRHVLVGVLLIALPSVLPAQSRAAVAADTLVLSLADVQRLTLTQNPILRAVREERAIAAGVLQQARLPAFNPDFSVVVPGPGIGGSRNATEFQLMQELQLLGQRGLRVSAARLGVSRVASVVENTSRVTLADASIGFYRAVSAQRRLQVTLEVFGLTERLVDAVRTQLREGEISQLESNLAEIEFGRARARVLAAQREANSAHFELARLIGVDPRTELRLTDSLTTVAYSTSDARGVAPAPVPALPVDSLTALALTRRPDLSAAVTAVREAEALIALTRREALPNLRIGVLAERNQGENRTRLGPAIGFSVPLFNRLQGLVSQRKAAALQALHFRTAITLQIQTDIAISANALTAANAEVAIYEASVRQPARANITLLEAAYRAGKLGLPTLLLLRNQLLDAELGYWQAWFARQEASVQLDAATGALQSPTDSTPLPERTIR